MILEGSFPVVGYTGGPRGGKSSIVADLAERNQGIGVEEAGLDYRLLTFELLRRQVVTPDMPKDEIERSVEKLGSCAITEIIANRHATVAQHGRDVFYEQPVGTMVEKVAPAAIVQEAVNTGFNKRVQQAIDSGKNKVLLVDHRDPLSVIKNVPAAKLVMNTFVFCAPVEAAWREASRKNIKLGSDEFTKLIEIVDSRVRADAMRKINPVIPEDGFIDYWFDKEIIIQTVERLAQKRFDGDYFEAFTECFKPEREYTDVIRHGAGTKAAQTGKQIYFDTTGFRNYKKPKKSMLKAARIMFNEAMEFAGVVGIVS